MNGNKLKTNYASRQTHEARTPLQGVSYNFLFQRPLPPTPRAETGLTPFKLHTDVGLGIISLKPGR